MPITQLGFYLNSTENANLDHQLENMMCGISLLCMILSDQYVTKCSLVA